MYTILKKLPFFCIFIILLYLVIPEEAYSQIVTEYKMPPKEIVDIVDTPPTPSVSMSPDGKWVLLMERPSMPSIAELSQPELRIAGHRINPKTNGPSRTYSLKNLKLKSISKGDEVSIKGLPSDSQIGSVSWSPDSKNIAFTLTKNNGIELWYTGIEDFTAKKLTGPELNSAYYYSFDWVSDSKTLMCKFIPKDRGPAPDAPTVPKGPIIQENIGKKAPARTYQDLLKNPYDEKLFEYYFTCRVGKVTLDGNVKYIGKEGIITSMDCSPNGKYILVETIHKPFSYIVPSYRFPSTVEIWDMNGNVVKEVAEIPLGEEVPIGFDTSVPWPRNFNWRSDEPATLYYVAAQDEGNPKKDVEFREKVYMLKEPFSDKPVELVSLNMRYGGISWCEKDMALVSERWRRTRKSKTWIINPSKPEKEKELLFDLQTEDRYNDPGRPVFTQNKYGRSVILNEKGRYIYLIGSGASPEGSFPFLDKFDLKNKTSERLWQCEKPYYESVSRLLDHKKQILLTRKESKTEPANYFIRDLKKKSVNQITNFPHPYPQLANVYKEYIRYNRDDGLGLTGTLYLPPGYKKEDGPLPLIIWAYPREFKSARAAGQVRGSHYRFTRISSSSVLLWLTQGYAVLDGAEMPIVGEGDEEPNDTFVKQLVANGKAAIDAVASRGYADPKRVAVGGHSYGAFMTANLLAHSDLFAAGIARSGAYNRTLTPFGFQNEARTFWEAPEIYFAMSPFMHAHKVNEPILLIHGQADNNSGTFPIQSERYYAALKGHGATVRLVMLPNESHGYRARESVLHMLWEMHQWLEKYVRNK